VHIIWNLYMGAKIRKNLIFARWGENKISRNYFKTHDDVQKN